ncbi:MAG: hypothetical protein NC305_01745 [Lachnospiraceae bacterium]|nr:hypothetical protein [Butyrivibrio sp.]MCM1342595.1 hypothetical protein [Muribaculaceae bacterium]MCM1409253.1 hypothetical protein [Lachnospiraceae bacterium]
MKKIQNTFLKHIDPQKLLTICFFALYFILGLSLLFRQPFGDPPDEFNRYLIPRYIAEHGTLPNGFDESIRIPSYGFSYAFQPILPYMVQGYSMRLAGCFTQDPDFLFYTARMVDFVFGLIMAVFLLLLGRKWFQNRALQWLFCFLTMFMPQSFFLHTYVNTDSCCMMSIAVMLYGLTCCLQDHFRYRSCLIMSIGIILCALSYYNAYGFILSCILLFTAHFLSSQGGRIRLDWKPLLKKGLFISALVLLGIAWWFIRSYILYDGDFLGLRTRSLCGELYGNENMKADVRVTYQSMGYSVPSMLFRSDFLVLSINSFICMYGPMIVTTALWIYRFYKFLFLVGILGSILPTSLMGRKTKGIDFSSRTALNRFFHANMALCILIPFILSIIYSYGTDYQPQGRYLMPMLLPLCYYCVRGLEKAVSMIPVLAAKLKKPMSETGSGHLLTGLCVFLILLIVLSAFITVYGHAFPYYAELQVR